jgi:hypothetical protein
MDSTVFLVGAPNDVELVARVEPAEPSEPGALGGFKVTCLACGLSFTNSLRAGAQAEAEQHIRWHIAQAKRAAR